MALTFGNATSDRVNHASATSLDDLAAWTVVMWVFPTTFTVDRSMWGKQDGAGNGRNSYIIGTGTGECGVYVKRATSFDEAVTNNGVFVTTNQWYFIAQTYDSAASAGSRIHIYYGSLSSIAAEATYTSVVNGSGAVNDAGSNFGVGNLNGDGSPANAFQGRIANLLHWNRVLSLGEIIEQQFKPHVTSGCVLYTECGFNGTGTQPDWSGNGNAGTVTGATIGDHVPLAQPFDGFFRHKSNLWIQLTPSIGHINYVNPSIVQWTNRYNQ